MYLIEKHRQMEKHVLVIPKILVFITVTKINTLHRIVMALLTFEFLYLRLLGIFLSTAMASLLTSEMKVETVQNNEPYRSSCLKHTAAQSRVALPIART